MSKNSCHAKPVLFRVFLLVPLLILCSSSASAKMAKDSSDGPLMGAGSHFAWVIFDDLKDELEKTIGREMIIFGKNTTHGVGCKAGLKAIKLKSSGQETFGFVCCSLSEATIEKEQIVVHPLANEPIRIVVNKDNPVEDLSIEQVRAIFKGDITNWKEVGGADKPIAVVARLHCKKHPGHWKTILPTKKDFRQERISVKSADQMAKAITIHKNAIGHIGAIWEYAAGDSVKIITVNGALPTAQNLKSGAYPFYRQLSAITDKNPSQDVLKLIKEVQTGPAFRTVSQRYDILPLNPARDQRLVTQGGE